MIFDSHKDKLIEDLRERIAWLVGQLERSEAERQQLMETIFVLQAIPYEKADSAGKPMDTVTPLADEPITTEPAPVNRHGRPSHYQVRMRAELESRFRAAQARDLSNQQRLMGEDPPRI